MKRNGHQKVATWIYCMDPGLDSRNLS